MKQIRKGVFETNSSSTHSISIDIVPTFDQMITPDSDGLIRVECGEFGWEQDKHYDAETKLSYAATWVMGIPEDSPTHAAQKSMLEKVVSDHTGGKMEIITSGDDDDYYKHGYIDHQSAHSGGGEFKYCFESPENLKMMLFNSGSYVETDHDNH